MAHSRPTSTDPDVNIMDTPPSSPMKPQKRALGAPDTSTNKSRRVASAPYDSATEDETSSTDSDITDSDNDDTPTYGDAKSDDQPNTPSTHGQGNLSISSKPVPAVVGPAYNFDPTSNTLQYTIKLTDQKERFVWIKPLNRGGHARKDPAVMLGIRDTGFHYADVYACGFSIKAGNIGKFITENKTIFKAAIEGQLNLLYGDKINQKEAAKFIKKTLKSNQELQKKWHTFKNSGASASAPEPAPAPAPELAPQPTPAPAPTIEIVPGHGHLWAMLQQQSLVISVMQQELLKQDMRILMLERLTLNQTPRQPLSSTPTEPGLPVAPPASNLPAGTGDHQPPDNRGALSTNAHLPREQTAPFAHQMQQHAPSSDRNTTHAAGASSAARAP